MGPQIHKPGFMKQANKIHKHGSHRSKRSVENALRGKVAGRICKKHKKQITKVDRINKIKQIRVSKSCEVVAFKNSVGTPDKSPLLICLVPLSNNIDINSALEVLENCDHTNICSKDNPVITYIRSAKLKKNYSIITANIAPGSELNSLDYLKVCDITVFVLGANSNADEMIDKDGYKFMRMALAQGAPTPTICIMNLASFEKKQQQQIKTAALKLIKEIFPVDKIITLDTNEDGLSFLRYLSQTKRKSVLNKTMRPHLFGEAFEFVPTDSCTGILKICGYLRGSPLAIENIVHILGLGDFHISQIDMMPDPCGKRIADPVVLKINICDTAIIRENTIQEMDSEQTWPAIEEMSSDNVKNKKKIIKRVPKGMSDYQACWIPDFEEVDDNEDNVQDDDVEMDAISVTSDMKIEADNESDTESEKSDLESDSVNDENNPTTVKYDQEFDLEEEKETFLKIKAARADEEYPDEVDTPFDISVKERYQKYRGLESFKSSIWDPKENLPTDYARIFKFADFNKTKKRIMEEVQNYKNGVTGSFVQLHIPNVPSLRWNTYLRKKTTEDIVLYGLLPHEHQMSVVHVVLKRCKNSTIPIKSKSPLLIQCGYRRFRVNPIFSQHSNGDKHKYEPYFRSNMTVVATFYAPIQFPPSPILCFMENPNKSLSLVATGNLLNCEPDRIILKRIILSGHPFKIHRKSASIRYMFFNREDIEYFKPCILRTKCGRIGHIDSALGTHGHMKCKFDGQLKSFDTVFLNLYKRIYPKWNYEEYIEDSN